MIVTNDTLKRMKRRYACRVSYEWATTYFATGGTEADFPAAVATKSASWYLWCVGKGVFTPDAATLDACARERTWAAVAYAAPFLTTATLEYCAEKEPVATLKYAAPRLTIGTLDYYAKMNPWAALRYAARFLTRERRNYCAREQPWAAIAYASRYLTKDMLEYCAKRLLSEQEELNNAKTKGGANVQSA